MNQFDSLSADQWRLIDGACQDQLTPEELRLLEQELAADAAFRARYVAALQMHADLHLTARATRSTAAACAAALGDSASPAIAAPVAAKSATPLVRVANATSWLSQPLNFSLFFALVTTVSLLLFFAQVRWDGEAPREDALAASDSAAQPKATAPNVAQLTAAHHARWVGSAPELNEELPAGRRLKLRRGWAEFTFASGARVVLEGPAEFTPLPDNAGRLHRGKLTGRVEQERAKGFAVYAADYQLIDLGTEFGVEIDAEGTASFHVFSGAVEVRRLTKRGGATWLTAGQALQWPLNAEAAVPIEASPTRFVRRLEDLPPGKPTPNEPTELSPDDPALAGHLRLWLRADQIRPPGAPPLLLDEAVSTWVDHSGRRRDAQWEPNSGAPPRLRELPSGLRVVHIPAGSDAQPTGRLRAPGLRGGKPFADLTLLAVYRTTPWELRDTMRLLGLGSLTSQNHARGGELFNLNLCAEPSLRFDGTYVSPALYELPHPHELFVRSTVRSGDQFSEYFNRRIALRRTHISRVKGVRDDFYVGELLHPGPAGEIAEVVLYDRALAADERAGVEAYLWRKWRLDAPDVHPSEAPWNAHLLGTP